MNRSLTQWTATLGLTAVAVLAVTGNAIGAGGNDDACTIWHPHTTVVDQPQHTLNPQQADTDQPQHTWNPDNPTTDSSQRSWHPHTTIADQPQHTWNPQPADTDQPQHPWNPTSDHPDTCPTHTTTT